MRMPRRCSTEPVITPIWKKEFRRYIYIIKICQPRSTLIDIKKCCEFNEWPYVCSARWHISCLWWRHLAPHDLIDPTFLDPPSWILTILSESQKITRINGKLTKSGEKEIYSATFLKKVKNNAKFIKRFKVRPNLLVIMWHVKISFWAKWAANESFNTTELIRFMNSKKTSTLTPSNARPSPRHKVNHLADLFPSIRVGCQIKHEHCQWWRQYCYK